MCNIFYLATAKTVKTKGKAAKDPNAPKRPQTAFFIFSAEKRDTIKTDNPGIAHTQIAVKAGEMWKALDADEKKEYEDKYKSQMAQWKIDSQEYAKTDQAKAFQNSQKSATPAKKSRPTKSVSKSKSPKTSSRGVTSNAVKSKEFVSDSDSSSDDDKKADSGSSDETSSDSD